MKVLIIILSILLLFAVALLIPVRIKIYFRYEGNSFSYDFKLKYGFITVKSPKKKKKEKGEKIKSKKKSEKKTLRITFSYLKTNAKAIKRLIKDTAGYAVKKLIVFQAFKLKAVIGTDDAMNTALLYGASSAFLYNTVGVMDKKIKMKNIDIDFKTDFCDEKIFVEFESIIKTKIYNVLGLALLVLGRALPLLKKRGEKNNGKSD